MRFLSESQAKWKSICRLNLSTDSTSTRTLSPMRITVPPLLPLSSVASSPSSADCAFKIFHQLDFSGIPFRVGAVLFSRRYVFGNFVESRLSHNLHRPFRRPLHVWGFHQVVQGAVHCQIRIAPYRRRKMGVINLVQAVMAVGGGPVNGAFQAF